MRSPCAVCGGTGQVPHLSVSTVDGSSLTPTTLSYGSAPGDIVRCLTCGHMQAEQLPEQGALNEEYADVWDGSYVAEEAGQRATARRALDRIERHIRPGALCDLGCWVGFLLSEAERRGWRVTGIEPSRAGAAYARERLGLEVRNAPLEQADLPPAAFDAAVMGDVIEHLPDAAGALDRVGAALAPGGVLALAVPDAGSRLARAMGRRWWAVVPTHVHYFTRGSLIGLLRRRGYEPLHVSTAPKAFTVRYYLGRLEGYSPLAASTLVAAAGRFGLAERIWAPDFGDRMLVIARAPPAS